MTTLHFQGGYASVREAIGQANAGMVSIKLHSRAGGAAVDADVNVSREQARALAARLLAVAETPKGGTDA